VTSDVFSAGVCIIEAMIGINPWRELADKGKLAAGAPGAVAESKRVSTIEMELELVPHEWRHILLGMVDRDARARFTAIQARDEWQKALGVHRSLEPIAPTTQLPETFSNQFESGKIEYQSWREIEAAIAEKIGRVGLDKFTLDVNTRAKMIVNFRTRRDESSAFQIYCPTTARNAKMAKLGWQFDPSREEFTRSYELDPVAHEVASLVSAALQIGFEVKLRDVGILI
jgi:hypothetical protein